MRWEESEIETKQTPFLGTNKTKLLQFIIMTIILIISRVSLRAVYQKRTLHLMLREQNS